MNPASQSEFPRSGKSGEIEPAGAAGLWHGRRVNLEEKQAAWRERYAVIPDPQERLAAIVSRRPRVAPVDEVDRTDANLVPGCLSRVWLVGGAIDGRLWLRVSAEATVVAALAAFLAEFSDGEAAKEAAAFEPSLLDDLGVGRLLTPTRRHGLEKVAARIRALAGKS